MVLQMTLMLPFLGDDRHDVVIGSAIGWAILLGGALAAGLAARGGLSWRGAAAIRSWLERFPFRTLWPFWFGFVASAAFVAGLWRSLLLIR